MNPSRFAVPSTPSQPVISTGRPSWPAKCKRGQSANQSAKGTTAARSANVSKANLGIKQAETCRRDPHLGLPAYCLPAKPLSNDSDWLRKDDDVCWQFGVPPEGKANFAWVQHFIHHFAPQGMAGFVLANGRMSSNHSGEGDIRRALIEADLVDTAMRDSAILQSEAIPQVLSKAKNNMVALPGQIFCSAQIPVCLWFFAKNKNADAKRGFRDQRKQTLFIDARKFGTLIGAGRQ